jgi:hypothetical protein
MPPIIPGPIPSGWAKTPATARPIPIDATTPSAILLERFMIVSRYSMKKKWGGLPRPGCA